VGISPGAEIAALILTVAVHIIGAGVLIWAMLSGDEHEDGSSWWRGWWPRDDDGGSPEPEPSGPRGGGARLPMLPDAEPAALRLREPSRLADAHPRPARRPEHVPERAPERAPAQR
jgi:hypothetical protein